VHDSIGVDVVQSIQDIDRNADGAVMVNPAFIKNLAQRAAFAPLHNQVVAGTPFAAQDAHQLRMVQPFADASLALK